MRGKEIVAVVGKLILTFLYNRKKQRVGERGSASLFGGSGGRCPQAMPLVEGQGAPEADDVLKFMTQFCALISHSGSLTRIL